MMKEISSSSYYYFNYATSTHVIVIYGQDILLCRSAEITVNIIGVCIFRRF